MALTSVKDGLGRSLTSAADTHPSNSSRRGHILRNGAIKMKEEAARLFDDELVSYLDGDHHADEIQVRFNMPWSALEKALGVEEIKDGKGRRGVTVIYR